MINVSVLRNGVRMPVVPIDNADANKSGVVVYNPTTKLFSIGDEVITVEDLILTGDIEVEGAAMFRDDVSISGDLFVDGQEHINDSETVQTTGDYFILRHNNGTPLATGENAGLAVFNYALNKTATLTVDKNGTWRIADNTASSTVYNNLYYFDGHYYNTSFVEQTFIDQIKTSFDLDEIANCVLYNNAFYHFDNVNWFTVTLVDNHLVTDATEITDATLIAALNALTKNDLQYFRRLQITTIVEVENQPLLTRDEATNMDNAALLQWDANNTRAVTIDVPVQNNTVLTAQVNPQTSVTTDYYSNDGGQNYYTDFTWTSVTPTGTEGTVVTLSVSYLDVNGTVYKKDGTDYYVVTDFDDAGTLVTDQSIIDDLDASTWPVWTKTPYTVVTPASTGYVWKTGGSGSVNRFATLAAAQAALAIPEGQDGYLGQNAIVLVENLNSYIKGEEQ